MSNGADQGGKTGGWRWRRIAAIVGALGVAAWFLRTQTDLNLVDLCALLAFVGYKDQIAACTTSNGGFYIAAILLLVLIGLGWLVLPKYKSASEGFALLVSQILGFLKHPAPDVPPTQVSQEERDKLLDFLDDLAKKGDLTAEQAKRYKELKSALVDQALTKLHAASGLSDSAVDAEAETAMTEAVEEAVDQGSDAQIEAMRFIGAGDIPAGLDRLAAAAEIATGNAAALWRQVGEIAYPIDTARARNAYERVMALGTVHPWDFIFLSRLLIRAGNLDQALDIAFSGLNVPALSPRDRSVLLDETGDVLVAKGDLDGALKRFQESLEIAQALAREDPGNAGWRLDVAFSHAKIALAGGDARAHWGEAVAILEALAEEGRLAPRNRGALDTARAQLAALEDKAGT